MCTLRCLFSARIAMCPDQSLRHELERRFAVARSSRPIRRVGFRAKPYFWLFYYKSYQGVLICDLPWPANKLVLHVAAAVRFP